MNDTVILDSNAIISLLDGNKTVARMLENVQQVLVPAIVCGEIDAGVFSFLKSAGTPIPTNDIWLAAAVLETGGLLITTDRHLLALPLVRTKAY